MVLLMLILRLHSEKIHPLSQFILDYATQLIIEDYVWMPVILLYSGYNMKSLKPEYFVSLSFHSEIKILKK